MPGPPKKPTALKKLHNPEGKFNKDEPMPPVLRADTPPPSELDGNPEAQKGWAQIVALTVGQGVATVADVAYMLMYANAYSDEKLADEMMKVDGYVQEYSTGASAVSAWFTVRRNARAERMKILSLFGLSPADRAKVSVEPDQKEKNIYDV